MSDPNIDATVQTVLGQLRRAGVTTGTGLTGYDLQAGAKVLIPDYKETCKLVARLPRVKGGDGLNTNFKAVTGINASQLTPGVGEGHRNAANTTNITTRSIPYASIGHDDLVTFEAIDAAGGWENLPSLTKKLLLWALFESEERVMLWGAGNGVATPSSVISPALGQGVVASTSTNSTGGSLPASTTYSLYMMPLTYEGVQLAGGYFTGGAGNAHTVASPFTRTNMGGTTDTIPGGAGQISAVSTQATASGTSTNVITANAKSIPGAAGYAWFIGTSAGTACLWAITSLPTVTFTSAPTGAQLASVFVSIAADNSQNTLEYMGLIPYIANSPLSYKADIGGAALASDGGRNIAQFLTAFSWYYNNYRTGPDTIWVSANKGISIDLLLSKNAGGQNNWTALINPSATDTPTQFVPPGPTRLIPNPQTGKFVKIEVHPLLNDSTILFTSDKVPFPASGIANAWEYRFQRDYYGMDWPVNNRQYEYGTYTRGALGLNAEMLFGVLTNVG